MKRHLNLFYVSSNILYVFVDSAYLRRGSAAYRLLEMWVRIATGAWMSLVIVVCCQLEVSESE
jgi:hypothetical protein